MCGLKQIQNHFLLLGFVVVRLPSLDHVHAVLVCTEEVHSPINSIR